MFRKSRAISSILLGVLLSILCGYTLAATPNTVKIALLDSPYNEMPLIPSLTDYEKAYFAGVETAAKVAKKYNIKIIYKPFIFNQGPLDIFGEIPKIEQWKADLVIGPSSSDDFLLLRNYFPNIMVLSSTASGDALKTLPQNFYSTLLPDSRIMELLSKSIKTKFPLKNIYIIEQVDCKQCVDVGRLFISKYKKTSPNIKIVERKLIMDNIDSIDTKKLMTGHTDDITIIFNSSYYAYNVFVKNIASQFPDKKLIFYSDQDNWSSEVDGQKHNFDLTYESYRIGPILLDFHSPEFKNFADSYYSIYHTNPSDAISYTTYVTVMSAVEALHQFNIPNTKSNMHEKILESYLAALKKNPDWFRSRPYGIYQLTSSGEVLVEKIPIPN